MIAQNQALMVAQVSAGSPVQRAPIQNPGWSPTAGASVVASIVVSDSNMAIGSYT